MMFLFCYQFGLLLVVHNFCIAFYWHGCSIKAIVHPKCLILASFTHPHVVPNLYRFLCSVISPHNESQWRPMIFWTPLTLIVWTK